MPSRRLFSKPPLGAQLNRAHPLAQYLRGFWLLNEGGGAPQNLVSSANVGTLGGTVSPTWTTSQNGRGLNFTAGGEQVNLGRGAFLDDLPVETFEALIYLRSLQSYAQRVIAKQDSGSTVYNTLLINTDGTLSIARQRATANTDYTTSTALSAGNWYHIAATFDTNNNVAAIYINGVESAYSAATNGSGALTSDAGNDLLLGNRPGNDRTFDGVMIYARVWSIYCTPAMATEIFANPYGVLQTPKRRTVADSLTLISASDTGAGGDVATSISASASTTDTGTGSEARALVVSSAAVDSASGAESTSIVAALSSAESATGVETSALAASIASSDAGSGADTSALSVVFGAIDSAAGGESSSLVVSIFSGDTASATDTSSLSTGASPSASDVAVGTESVLIVVTLVSGDTGASTDASLAGASTQASDSATSSEARSLAASIQATDAGAGADVSQIGASLVSSDAAISNESSALVVGLNITSSDAGAGGEITATLSASVASVDVLSAVEAASLSVTTQALDTATMTESVALAATMTGADIASALDASALTVSAMLLDAGAGNEGTSSLVAQVATTDAGVLVESSRVAATASASDTAVGTESVTIQVFIASHDSGAFAEAVLIATMLTAGDVGSGRERSALAIHTLKPKSLLVARAVMGQGRGHAKITTVRDRGGRVPKMRKR